MGSKVIGGGGDNMQKVVTVVSLIATTWTGFAVNKAYRQLAALGAQEIRDKVFSEDHFTQLNTLAGGTAVRRCGNPHLKSN
jgi:hypothetical protein